VHLFLSPSRPSSLFRYADVFSSSFS
jgi:hypothetical protein